MVGPDVGSPEINCAEFVFPLIDVMPEAPAIISCHSPSRPSPNCRNEFCARDMPKMLVCESPIKTQIICWLYELTKSVMFVVVVLAVKNVLWLNTDGVVAPSGNATPA